jgi:three-Cys-motif partner protein
MSDKLPTIWELAPHTKAKHDLLTRYLGGWYAILSKYNRRIIFFDGFAGPGIYSEGEPGSPALALKVLIDHQYQLETQNCEFVLIFNEQDKERFESLKKVVADLEQRGLPKHIRVGLYNRSFVDVGNDILERLENRGQTLAPTFAFLDPFGYRDVPIDLVRRLLAFDKCELFAYFDFNSVTRFSTAGVVDKHFEALYGTDKFKDAPPKGDPNRKIFLHDLYQRQLKEVCGFPYVQSFEMVNKNNRTGYYLFFCTRNLKGLVNMKEAMWKVAPGGDFRFSDLLAGQTVLFGDDPDTSVLQQELARKFAGQRVSITTIEEFVVVNTPFCKSHVKRRTLAPMQKEGLISSPNQGRKYTFPDGTLIDFF